MEQRRQWIVQRIRELAMCIDPLRIAAALTIIALVLLVLSLIGQYTFFQDEVGHRTRNLLFAMFNLDGERKIPTLFSALLILWNAGLLFLVALSKAFRRGAYVIHWFVLSMIFVYLSYDEATKIHEWAMDFMMPWFGSDFLHFWVIPASIIMAFLGLLYLRFLMHLPVSTRNLFLLSAAVYLGGALGMETIGGLYAEQYQKNNFAYSILADIEEIAEMLGMILFGYTLLVYLQSLFSEDDVRVG